MVVCPQLGGVYAKCLRTLPDGTFSLRELREAVKEDDVHLPITSLVCVENTHNKAGGAVLPLDWLDQVCTAGFSLYLVITNTK